MNIQTLRTHVGDILDYSPDVEEYILQVNSVLNDIYLEMFMEHAWKFAQKTVDITLYADEVVTSCSASLGDTKVTGAASSFSSWMEGHIAEVAGTTSDDGEYIVAHVESDTEIYLEDYSSTINEADITITVKQRYIDLPSDCVHVLDVFIRDYNNANNAHIEPLTRFEDEYLTLDIDQTGTPYRWVPQDEAHLPAPVVAPTLTDNGPTANGVPVDGEYEVAYTFVYNGKETAMSPAAAITMSAGDEIGVNVPNTGANSGIYKKLYFKNPNTRAFYSATNSNIAEITTVASLEMATNYTFNQDRAPEHDGNYLVMRLYPRQDDSYSLRVRYLYRPPQLQEDSDVPEFPSSSHKFLIDRACEELFVKHNNLSHSELYKQKAARGFLKLKNRYLSEKSTLWVKQSFTNNWNPRTTKGKLTRA
jgi:hypothetical protein